MSIVDHPLPRQSDIVIYRKPRWTEGFIHVLLFICGSISILSTISLVIVLGHDALLFFLLPDVTLVDFLTGTTWLPSIGKYGVIPLVTATLITTFFAISVALPLGLSAAIFLSEYASQRTRGLLKPILEILAGIPSVVYGFFALTFITPLLRTLLGNDNVQIYNMLSAGLVMGIMILPLVCSMSEDALFAVPHSLRDAAYSLGSTKVEMIFQIVLPAALSGIIASVILAISRAIGETMIVALAAGSGSSFTFNPLNAAETMTGYIARISGGDIAYDTPEYNAIFAIGFLLFTTSFVLNLIGRRVTSRFREVYE
ncbi:MAG: phosphate ABC transporter permease subunit PstC [Anaerolineaceae bacterium]|nr:phosphate ABC transporter permease subunit PstC [Anaerolineaceae bacterium]MBN2678459.1 phosphate ABC transporter permease subunit PstC [Anaerolineaceae bacterium]